MTSLLTSLFWSSAKEEVAPTAGDVAAASSAPIDAAVQSEALVASDSNSLEDDFVLVGSAPASAAEEPTPAAAVTSSEESSKTSEATLPVESAPAPAVAVRSCRPYGHAHSPPALIASPAAALPAPASKRSFASVAAAIPSPLASVDRVAYAQAAESSYLEQLRAKITDLELAALEAVVDPVDPLDYASPVPVATVRLPRESSQRYGDEKTAWAFDAEAPSAKRAKRVAASHLLLSKADAALKAAKLKGKPQKAQRVDELALRRAREEKLVA